MPTQQPNTERLELRFHAADSAAKATVPGGWLMWMLVGLAVGLGVWLVGGRLLRQRLSNQLADSSSSTEAFVALESLLQLGGTSSHEIVRGLENEDATIARASFRALNEWVGRWQQSDSPASIERMEELAAALVSLPASTPPENRLLASSLATRIFAFCLERDDPMLSPLMKTCQRIVAASSGLPAESTSVADDRSTTEQLANEFADTVASFGPPPPLEQIPNRMRDSSTEAVEFSLADDGQFTASLSDSTPSPSNGFTTPAATVTSPPMASLRLVPFSQQASLNDPVSETSYSLSSTSGLSDSVDSQNAAWDTSSNQSSSQPPPLEGSMSASRSFDDQPSVRMTLKTTSLAGIEDKSDEELVRLLSSVQPRLSQAAVLELRSRGWPDEHLEIALELATSSEQRRLELVHHVATRGDLNPRPWLLWMAESGQTEVRRTAVSLIHSMVDPNVERELRGLLRRERDESVCQTIRQVLVAYANQ